MESRSTNRDDMASPTSETADPNSLSPNSARPRRGSFSFLRRSKSRESTDNRRVTSDASGSRKLSRRSKKDKPARETAPDAAAAPQISQATLPQINAPFGSGIPHTTPSSAPPPPPLLPPSTSSSTLPPGSRSGYDPNAFYKRHLMAEKKPPQVPLSIPVPPVPGSVDDAASAANTESMANRGRYSYASSMTSPGVNGPRRVRRRKDPTPFNVLVIGTPHCGKTSFIEFLRHALTRPVRMRHTSSTAPEETSKTTRGLPFSSHYLETELEGERIGLTLWDGVSLEKHIIDIQMREVTSFIEGKFHETFTEESKVLRSTNVRDTHIHCVLFVMDPQQLDLNLSLAAPNARAPGYPSRPANVIGGLDSDFEGQVLRTLEGMTTVIPIISKADTITTAHMSYLKRVVWDSFKKLKIDPLDPLHLEVDDDESTYESAVSVGDDDDDTAAVQAARAASAQSSNYDNANEEPDKHDDALDDGDKTPVKKNFSSTDAPNGLKPSGPQHAAMARVSELSMNVDLPQLPLSVISPDIYEPGTIGRRFPWGFADPYNADHCDFVKLMDNVFNEWRGELRTVARERWYENWRTNRLKTRSPPGHVPLPPAPRSYPQRAANPSYSQNTTRAVSSAAAYGGKAVEQQQVPRATSATNVAPANGAAPPPVPVAVADIGVAVSNGVGTAIPPALPKTNSYRGIGTY